VGRESSGNVVQQLFPFLQTKSSFEKSAAKNLLSKGYASSEMDAQQKAGYVAEMFRGDFTKPLSPLPVYVGSAFAYNRITEAGGRLSFQNAFSKLESSGYSFAPNTASKKLFNLPVSIISSSGILITLL
jgi:hypothetical protein